MTLSGYIALMIDERMILEHWYNDTDKGKLNCSAVRGQQLTSWSVAQSLPLLSLLMVIWDGDLQYAVGIWRWYMLWQQPYVCVCACVHTCIHLSEHVKHFTANGLLNITAILCNRSRSKMCWVHYSITHIALALCLTCFMSFCSNTPHQYTSLHTLHPFIFSLMPFD
jgi:hypothetical protein